jgi:hypothetical protein
VLVSEFLTHVNYALRGTDDDAPEVGEEEASYWIATLNRKKDELYRNAKVLWDETYSATTPNEPGTVATAGTTALTGTSTKFLDYRVGDKITVDGETERTIATITSNTALTVTVAFSNTSSGLTFTRDTIIGSGVQTYSCHRNLIAPASSVYVQTTTQKHYQDLVEPRESDPDTQAVYLAGVNPKILHFAKDIAATDPFVGGSLVMPGYYLPADVSAAADELPLPDPYWGVLATASEVAGSDITYEDREANLNSKANNLYMQMVRSNRRGTYNNPHKSAVNVYKIRNAER